MANYKALIGISAVIVVGLGGFYLYQTQFKPKRKEEEAPAPETPAPAVSAPAPVKPKITTPAATPPREPGFVQPAKGPQSVAVKAPKMGAKIFVLSASGANAYKTAVASTGNIYKFYKKGAYVGTFLSQKGAFSEVIVQEDAGIRNPLSALAGKPINKTVFLRSTEIYT